MDPEVERTRRERRGSDGPKSKPDRDEPQDEVPGRDASAVAASAKIVPAGDGAVETEAPEGEVPALREEIAALRAERDDLEDRFLRLAAEFDNFRKRTAREWREQKERAAGEVLLEMLELADNLERALGAAEEPQALGKGVELIYQQVQATLKRFGVEPIEAEGRSFDPTEHEAVLVVEAQDQESDRVVDVVRRGYRLHGEVLRPARVTVAR